VPHFRERKTQRAGPIPATGDGITEEAPLAGATPAIG
jgi:hypothetical protein